MTITFRAIYEGGILHPTKPLALAEGETVEVTVARTQPARPVLRRPTAAEEDYAQRIKAAKSMDEMFAVMETAPPSPDDTIDIVQLINESRRLTGFRMPDRDPAAEEPR